VGHYSAPQTSNQYLNRVNHTVYAGAAESAISRNSAIRKDLLINPSTRALSKRHASLQKTMKASQIENRAKDSFAGRECIKPIQAERSKKLQIEGDKQIVVNKTRSG
jgi:hypothetical protein